MFDLEIVKERIRIAKGNDTQQDFADKLGMTQGNVSKMLNKDQMPALDTIYSISKQYKVSSDWLLGLSESKELVVTDGTTTYASAAEMIMDMIRCGNVMTENQANSGIDIHVCDLLLKRLCMKGAALQGTDTDSYKTWIKEKLSEFDDKPLLWAGIWDDEVLSECLNRATMERDMAEEYIEAKARVDELAEMAE